jgi:uncharacterized protein (TIGR03067 family)
MGIAMTRGICVAGIALLLVGAGPKEKEPAADLQGTWKALRIENTGKQQPEKALKTISVVIKDLRFQLKNGEKIVEEVTLKLDAEKDPKQIDLTPVRGKRKDMPHLGIYVLEKDQLRICWGEPGKPRPTAFESDAKSGNFLIVLTRSE